MIDDRTEEQIQISIANAVRVLTQMYAVHGVSEADIIERVRAWVDEVNATEKRIPLATLHAKE